MNFFLMSGLCVGWFASSSEPMTIPQAIFAASLLMGAAISDLKLPSKIEVVGTIQRGEPS